jgi:hypothetical protein
MNPEKREILRLSLRIAVARYDLEEAIFKKTPISQCQNIMQEIAICLLQRSAIINKRYKDLPYNIKLLYN